ncbi:uncharacterized protein [Rutidosis leptorrhynchoides]|uniref:uncharacterized protein n=1 Tax=Rutidosis leptorrhynchoides TaxID=125765 RepID=UPI003A9A0054
MKNPKQTQGLNHVPKSFYSYWDAEQESHILCTSNLLLFITGDTSKEVQLRDFGSSLTTPSKHKSKKNVEPTPSPSTTHVQAADDSFGTNVKVILGIALVSTIIGIVLGKCY